MYRANENSVENVGKISLISSVALITESGKKILLPSSEIEHFFIASMSKSVATISKHCFGEFWICDTMSIAVNKNIADTNGMDKSYFTAACLSYADGTERIIEFPWLNGWTPAENAYQSDTTNNGFFIVTISATENAVDFLDWTEDIEPVKSDI